MMIAREIDRHEHIPLALNACRNKNYYMKVIFSEISDMRTHIE